MPCARWREALPEAVSLARAAAGAALSAAQHDIPSLPRAHPPGKGGTARFPEGAMGADRREVELSLVLADDAQLRALNRRWRDRDAPTNVLSFASGDPPLPGHPHLLGDVLLAFETVQREAGEQGKPLADHLRHLVIHGVLHLLGFDHLEDAEAERMEALERRALAELGVGDPYLPRERIDG